MAVAWGEARLSQKAVNLERKGKKKQLLFLISMEDLKTWPWPQKYLKVEVAL
jgi:hypothetical protein